jgi:hypothetical protein
MLMANLTRRLQLLVDDDRYALLEKAAAERGTPVAVVVREALDRMFASETTGRREAGDRLLRARPMPVGDWDEIKREILALNEGRSQR